MKKIANYIVFLFTMLCMGKTSAQAIIPAEIIATGEVKLLKSKSNITYMVYSVPVNVNGTAAQKIVVNLKPDNGNWKALPSFLIKGSSLISDVCIFNNKLYVVGDFGFVDAKWATYNCVAEFNFNSQVWNANMKFIHIRKPVVTSVCVGKNRVYFGGSFDNLTYGNKADVKVNNLIYLDSTFNLGIFVNKTDIGLNGRVNEMANDAVGNLFIGGLFSKLADKSFNNIFYFNANDSIADGVGKSFKEVFSIKYSDGNLLVLSRNEDTLLSNKISYRNSLQTWNEITGNDSIMDIRSFTILNTIPVFCGIGKNKGNLAGLYKILLNQKTYGRLFETFNRITYAEKINSNEIYVAGNFALTYASTSGLDNLNFGKMILNHVRILGRVFWDENRNQIMDGNDVPMPNVNVQVQSSKMKFLVSTEKLGYFTAVVPIQKDSIFISLPDIGGISNFKKIGFRTDTVFNKLWMLPIQFKRDNSFNDLRVSVSSRGGFIAEKDKKNIYAIRVTNNGITDAKNTLLKFNYPKGILDSTFSVKPGLNAQHTATWTLPVIPPGASYEINFSGLMSGSNFTEKQAVQFSAQAIYSGTDDLPTNNADSLNQSVSNTNNLIAKFQNIQPAQDNICHLNPNDGKIDYVIRFSNPTSDTINTVAVIDTVDIPDYVTYVQELGSSHAFSRYIYTTPSLPNKILLNYTFSNIHLHPNVNNSYENSYAVGYISIRVGFDSKTVPNGTVFTNRASVYLDDYNPILTNTVNAKVDNTVSVKNSKNSNSIKVYPNPVESILNIENKNLSHTAVLRICDVNGKIVKEQNLNFERATTQVEVKDLNTGVYFVIFMSEKETITQRFIKH